MRNTYNWIPVQKSTWLRLLGVLTAIGMTLVSNAILWSQTRYKVDSSPTHQVPVPGLGQNPWLIESFFKDIGVDDSRDGAIRDQLDALKKLLENQKIPLEPGQKELLENLLKAPGTPGGVDGLREIAKGLISKVDPAQQKLIREKISSISRGEGRGDLFSDFEKKRSGVNRSYEDVKPRNGTVSKMPKAMDSNGASLPKSIPPPFPDEANNSPGVTNRNTTQNTDKGSAGLNSLGESRVNSNVGDLSRMLSRVLPFGLGQQVVPFGKDFLKKVAGWSANIRLPESWKPGIQKVIRELNFPGTMDRLPPSLPSGPNIGGSFSGSNIVYVFMIGTGVLILAFLFASKWNRMLESAQSGTGQPTYSGQISGFVSALELAIIRLGGKSQAYGNHLKWKRDCGAMFVARGMGEESVAHIFEVYESAKYLGRQPSEAEELRLMEALNRYA
jgi:hypothetical protein